MNSLKQRESTSCDMKAVLRRVADAKGNMNDQAGGLFRDSSESYDSIRHGVNQSLSAISKRRKKTFDREAKSLQHNVLDALCNVAGVVQKSFVETSEVIG